MEQIFIATHVLLICLLIITHRYLGTYQEMGKLPYSHGYDLYTTLSFLILGISYIYLLGFVGGIIFFLLHFFNLLSSCFFWIFQIPGIIKTRKYKDMPDELVLLAIRPQMWIVYSYSWIVIFLALSTITNFFILDSKILLSYLLDSLNINYREIIILSLGILVVGNIIRWITMKILFFKK